jgi:hypothetical protein
VQQQQQPGSAAAAAATVLPAEELRVGRLLSRSGSLVRLTQSAAEYTFRHGQLEVQMTMHYCHIGASLAVRGKELSFQVHKRMPAFSAEDYDPQLHRLSIVFSTRSAAETAAAIIRGQPGAAAAAARAARM